MRGPAASGNRHNSSAAGLDSRADSPRRAGPMHHSGIRRASTAVMDRMNASRESHTAATAANPNLPNAELHAFEPLRVGACHSGLAFSYINPLTCSCGVGMHNLTDEDCRSLQALYRREGFVGCGVRGLRYRLHTSGGQEK